MADTLKARGCETRRGSVSPTRLRPAGQSRPETVASEPRSWGVTEIKVYFENTQTVGSNGILGNRRGHAFVYLKGMALVSRRPKNPTSPTM